MCRSRRATPPPAPPRSGEGRKATLPPTPPRGGEGRKNLESLPSPLRGGAGGGVAFFLPQYPHHIIDASIPSFDHLLSRVSSEHPPFPRTATRTSPSPNGKKDEPVLTQGDAMPDRLLRPRTSRDRYHSFVHDYKQRKLDEKAEKAEGQKLPGEPAAEPSPDRRGKRRAYLRDYFRWLRPHVYAIAGLFALALIVAGLEMVEPLFMRFIVDRVVLNPGLDLPQRVVDLNIAGLIFLTVIVLGKLVGMLREYLQRMLNTRVMLSLRRSLFERFLHLPLPKLWDMKTGGILSRLTGDIDTTTGLLQMAIISPALSVTRLLIAVMILLTLNWRLGLMALAVIPGAMLMSFASARRIRPIYRSVRKDVEEIDGRVGETFSGIRVVRAFGGEKRESLDYTRGRHTVLRKELFAHRRELVLWTSWGLLVAGVNVVIVWYGGYLNVVGRASVGDIMAFQWYTF